MNFSNLTKYGIRVICFFAGHEWERFSKWNHTTLIVCDRCGKKEVVL